ncbi:hypothetical protein AG1IA_05955 [Rhizoctonia solani AG-1 IA]|uniref:Uncharacterized protein n=1 Tax=Thanatephorus cucumeris (strain AG1-IA) TaxID=983506 RepID=L8WPD1_THACA|nr:hypothetical protein AG1IA_05955 [Rhizoctonia solani AG-1 IA]
MRSVLGVVCASLDGEKGPALGERRRERAQYSVTSGCGFQAIRGETVVLAELRPTRCTSNI